MHFYELEILSQKKLRQGEKLFEIILNNWKRRSYCKKNWETYTHAYTHIEIPGKSFLYRSLVLFRFIRFDFFNSHTIFVFVFRVVNYFFAQFEPLASETTDFFIRVKKKRGTIQSVWHFFSLTHTHTHKVSELNNNKRWIINFWRANV